MTVYEFLGRVVVVLLNLSVAAVWGWLSYGCVVDAVHVARGR